LAGPVANLLLAVLVYWGLGMAGSMESRAVIAAPEPQTAAALAGLAEGDAILAVNGEPAVTWNDLRWKLIEEAARGARVRLEVRTPEGATGERTLDLGTLSSRDIDDQLFDRIGLNPGAGPPVARALVPGGAAERAGLLPGDHIRAIAGEPVSRARDVSERVRAAPGKPLVLRIERAGRLQDIEVVPAAVAGEGGTRIGRIGIDFRELVEVRYGVVDGFTHAVGRVYDTSVFSLKTLGRMLIGEASWRNLSGPVTIADYAGQTARSGIVPWLGFLALVSISLGVLNLLPIPMLDGGHLLYYAIETVRGSPPPDRWIEIGQRFGVAVMILLTALALFNDVARLLP
jgi:regulator of sigma E protease